MNPHPSVYEKIIELMGYEGNYSRADKWLKSLWCTTGERREYIRKAKEHKLKTFSLGNISSSVEEFNKSLKSPNARVICSCFNN